MIFSNQPAYTTLPQTHESILSAFAMKAFIIGGSKNIGYYAAQRLLSTCCDAIFIQLIDPLSFIEHGATVTFLLRNKSCFDADETIQQYVRSGKARLVSGDALKEEDVRKAWAVADEGDDGSVDTVFFSVGRRFPPLYNISRLNLSLPGGTPNFSITKGFYINPPDLCAHSMLNVLSVFPRAASPQPRLVLISSTGLGRTAHAAVPFALKPLYGILLPGPHRDKLGMERAIAHAAGFAWPAADGEPDAEILPEGWQAHVGEGWLKSVLVVRPALLTDGVCKGDASAEACACKGDAPAGAGVPYRVDSEEMKGQYTVSRQDVAHFVAERALADWSEWEGKIVRIAY
ncbi:hypothetical protein DFH11DRAFT_1596224 [Phellopilus nigrolimitatus]|nr:hypothetical protein DFH11DRAFT_1596224 [Phellopilus nigrolimitatus]